MSLEVIEMLSKSPLLVCASLAFFVCETASVAQQSPPPQPVQSKPKSNAHDRICETIGVTGSRLGGTRVCATRAEWEEMRRQDQDAIQRAQVSACLPQSNAGGKPSCRQ